LGYIRASKAINLEETDKIPHWEFISNPDFEYSVTGVDPYIHPQSSKLKLIEILDLDIGSAPLSDEPIPIEERFTGEESSKLDEQGNRVVRWGTRRSWVWNWGKEFRNIEQALEFDPRNMKYDSLASEFALNVEELAEVYERKHNRLQALVGKRCLVPGGFYKTLFMWPLMTFGWELFLEIVLKESRKFQRLLEEFALISQKVMEAWATTDIELFVSHDDICNAQGPVFRPEWYREVIYPWYEKLWTPLKKNGIKVIFLSDGNVDRVADDIFRAGADGIFCEPYSNLERLLEDYGDSKIIVGNIDARILTFGTKKEITREVERCTKSGRDCPGYFYSVSNHIPYNVPVENVVTYFETCKRLGRRM
jgi:hypothetical protein